MLSFLGRGWGKGDFRASPILLQLAARNPQDMRALAECMSDIPWRRERYGEEILKVLKKVQGK